MQNEPLIIWYKPLRANAPSSIEEILQRVILFTFSDAGFNSLAGSRSTQSAVIILGLATLLVTSCKRKDVFCGQDRLRLLE